MKKTEASGILTLIAELEKDSETLERLVKENDRAAERIAGGADEGLDYAALGYTIHNIYCLMENYFLRVAKTFENQILADSWHKDLIRRMTLTIEGIRPALLDEETAEDIDELRSFRHVFRNLYQSGIKPNKVMEIQRKLPAVLAMFGKCHRSFLRKLRTLVK